MSKTAGYARVSTSEKNLDRAGYQSLKVGIGKLVSGETLYIKPFNRLSRNKNDLKKELQYFSVH